MRMKQISIGFSNDLREWLEKEAKEKQTRIATIVRQAVKEKKEKKESENK